MTDASTLTGATQLVQSLEQLRVELVFGLPGVHNLPIWKAVSESGIRLSASATSRQRCTRPTATPAPPAGSASPW